MLTTMIRVSGNCLADECHRAAAQWWIDMDTGEDVREWPKKQLNLWIMSKLALIHSEVSEAVEGLRKGLQDDKLEHRSMFETELADVCIRAFDLAGGLGIDLGDIMAEKMQYNSQREDHKVENRKKAGGKAI